MKCGSGATLEWRWVKRRFQYAAPNINWIKRQMNGKWKYNNYQGGLDPVRERTHPPRSSICVDQLRSWKLPIAISLVDGQY